MSKMLNMQGDYEYYDLSSGIKNRFSEMYLEHP